MTANGGLSAGGRVLERAQARDIPALVALQRLAYAKNRPLLGVEPLPLLADYDALFESHEIWLARGDAGTVSEHLHVLASESPDVQAVYRVLAEATLRRAVDGGRLAPHSASTLDQVLHPQEEAP